MAQLEFSKIKDLRMKRILIISERDKTLRPETNMGLEPGRGARNQESASDSTRRSPGRLKS